MSVWNTGIKTGIRPGNVSTERIAPILYTLIRERWPHGGGMDVLAEKVGCDPGAIAHIIDQTNDGVEFDLADNLLCALGRPDLWWGVLSDTYWDVDLSTVKCLREGCSVTFVPRLGGRNGPDARQLYCGRKCAHMDWKFRKGIIKDARKRNLKTHCRNGHKRTDSNQVRRGGYPTCAECVKARRTEARARRTPEKIAADKEYQRGYYARRKVALA